MFGLEVQSVHQPTVNLKFVLEWSGSPEMRLYNFFSAGFEMRKNLKSATLTFLGSSGPRCGISTIAFAHEFIASLSYGNWKDHRELRRLRCQRRPVC
jgi:hypothetical protein